MDEVPHNPYAPPEAASSSSSPALFDAVAFVQWLIVFALNLLFPVCWGLYLTNEYGRIGMAIGVLMLLTAGWTLCAANPSWARKLNAGATLVAVSQVFPILHIFLGAFAVGIAAVLKLAVRVPDDAKEFFIPTVAGGFVVTLIVGCGLLFFAGFAGHCLGLILPKRWFEVKEVRRVTDDD